MSSDDQALAKLTPREREYLLLVAAGLGSKEIGAIFAIESGSVDQALKRAAWRSGVAGRKRLARLLVAKEPALYQATYQRMVQHQKTLVPPIAGRPDEPIAPDIGEMPPPKWWWPIPTKERQWNDLSAWERRGWAIAIALGLAAASALLLTLSRHTLLGLPTFHQR